MESMQAYSGHAHGKKELIREKQKILDSREKREWWGLKGKQKGKRKWKV